MKDFFEGYCLGNERADMPGIKSDDPNIKTARTVYEEGKGIDLYIP